MTSGLGGFSRVLAPLGAIILGIVVTLAATQSQAAPHAAGAEVSAQDIAQRVQAFYDNTKTFRAAFKQTYVIRSTGIEKKSFGDVLFAKPGKMSWRYKNNGNRVIADGKLIRVYEEENKQMFESEMGKSAYPAALSFLVGEGKLQQSFALKKLDARQMKFEGGFVIEATPKEATPAYKAMILYVDAATAQVRRVLLVDAQGNRNRFDFLAQRLTRKWSQLSLPLRRLLVRRSYVSDAALVGRF